MAQRMAQSTTIVRFLLQHPKISNASRHCALCRGLADHRVCEEREAGWQSQIKEQPREMPRARVQTGLVPGHQQVSLRLLPCWLVSDGRCAVRHVR